MAALALCAPAAANGDIIAAVDVPVAMPNGLSVQSTDQFDIALLDATTGERLPLPPGINTSAEELHPSITPDGRWLAFERVDLSAGTRRIIVVDLSSGRQADLFNAFETQQPTTPFVLPDGSEVITGEAFAPARPAGLFSAGWTSTSLANFPSGPFSHRPSFHGGNFLQTGRTVDPIERPSPPVFGGTELPNGTTHARLWEETPSNRDALPSSRSFGAGHPAISDPTNDVVVFENRSANGGSVAAQLFFEPAQRLGTVPAAELPRLVNATCSSCTGQAPAFDEAFPAFTPNGRYLGFVRHSFQDGHDRLFVFDTITQTLLNSQGIDLGLLATPTSVQDQLRRLEGNLSLREAFVFTGHLSTNGIVSFQLAQGAAVGIFVQRVIGHHLLFGHRVRTLRTVGRVPFGQFGHGHHRVHWNLRVNGRRLPRGTYLVTPRALARGTIVRELGAPRVVRIG
jgi:hypothetical protein